MKASLNALISALTALATIVGVYYFVPIGLGEPAPSFGTTVTTIQGSDTLSSSRTVINNNFAALNTGKLETNVAEIPTLTHVGTINNGVWNGTPITVTFGGTGSTTLSLNQLLLGNGASGIKTPVGWGSSGQSLISNGAGVAPSWQSASFDTTQNYTFTGFNTFSATTSLAASNVNSNALIINTLAYAFPGSRGAASSILTENGSGNLTWSTPQDATISVNSPGSSSSLSATTTLATVVIPANTITGNSIVKVYANFENNPSGTCYAQLSFGNGSATTTAILGAVNSGADINMTIMSTTTLGGIIAGTLTHYSAVTEQLNATFDSAQNYYASSNAAVSYVAFAGRCTSGTIRLDSESVSVLSH